MAINERAKQHYDNAVVFMTSACQAKTPAQTKMFTDLVHASLNLADFCVNNHALVAGIDDSDPVQVSHPDSEGGPRLWGGSAKPDWVARAQAQAEST